MRPFLMIALIVVLALGIGIQVVPYGRQHTNPPVLAEPNWGHTSNAGVGGARLLRLPQQ